MVVVREMGRQGGRADVGNAVTLRLLGLNCESTSESSAELGSTWPEEPPLKSAGRGLRPPALLAASVVQGTGIRALCLQVGL